jgi:hypothetical protein
MSEKIRYFSSFQNLLTPIFLDGNFKFIFNELASYNKRRHLPNFVSEFQKDEHWEKQT